MWCSCGGETFEEKEVALNLSVSEGLSHTKEYKAPWSFIRVSKDNNEESVFVPLRHFRVVLPVSVILRQLPDLEREGGREGRLLVVETRVQIIDVASCVLNFFAATRCRLIDPHNPHALRFRAYWQRQF